MDTPEYLKAEKTALNLIARAEQCSAGLARKLEKRKHDSSVINEVISSLTGKKLIDDSRYARFWLQSRLRFTRSPRQLLSSLCAKGIDRDEAASALSSVLDEETEFALLERFVKKYERKSAGKRDNTEDVTRSLKFLLRNEGFSMEAVQRFLNRD
ncbi:MAG: recombination regulator RecX [Treponema sp.]|nr:recombination regulator RecX [Treponema sp.]MCL2273022.1 recombination regulator RecX [Treponema sp.]